VICYNSPHFLVQIWILLDTPGLDQCASTTLHIVSFINVQVQHNITSFRLTQIHSIGPS